MSLRVRLLIAVGAVAVVALVIADVATYRSIRSFMLQRIDRSLDAAHVGVEHSGGPEAFGPRPDGGPEGGGPQLRGLPPEGNVAAVAPGTFVERRDASGKIVGAPVLARQAGGAQLEPRLPTRVAGLRSPPGPGEPRTYLTVPSTKAGGPLFRVRVSELAGGGQLIVGVPLGDVFATLHRLLLIELSVSGAAIAIAILIGWWLVRIGLRPLRAVERTADEIAQGKLDRRVPGDDASTEVGRLARALNTMLARIEDAFRERDATEGRLRRFVADASHELRTPLAAVSAYGEMFERGAAERPDDLARVIAGIRDETSRMGRLVEDLLTLARLDDKQPLDRKAVDLVALAGEAVATARTVGPQWPLRLEATRPVEVEADAARLRQVVDNLLANVRAHTPAGTLALVRVGENGRDAVLAVADRGPGLDGEQMARVFERFYRADPSRSREHGGAGLGLGIVAAIVGAHGGHVEASATPGGGTTFTVRLPRTAD